MEDHTEKLIGLMQKTIEQKDEQIKVVLCQEKVQVKSELFLQQVKSELFLQHSIFSSSQSFYFIQFLFIHILIFVW